LACAFPFDYRRRHPLRPIADLQAVSCIGAVIVKHSMRPFAAMFFLTILALYSIRGVLGATEIAYDDGRPETTSSLDVGMHLAVKFSLPSGVSRAKLVRARIFKAGRSGIEMRVHILESDGAKELTMPFNVSLAVEGAWNDANVSARNILVSDIFYVTIEYLMYYDPLIGRDTSNPKGRSYYGHPGSWNLVDNSENVMIRAVIEHQITVSSVFTGARVAEDMLIFSVPYLFLACVVAMILVVLVVRRDYDRRIGEGLSRNRHVASWEQ